MKRCIPIVLLSFALSLLCASGAAAECDLADVNNDNHVNVDDLLIVLNEWGVADSDADVTGDGTVNVDDLLHVLNNWGPVEFAGGGFPDHWISGGPDCGAEPDIQIHQYNEDFYILRQSLCTNFEGPFIYLIFGEEKVLMQDTGAGGIAIADTVYTIIDEWLDANDQDSIELIVSHSHGHGDHVAGNSQFTGQPNTTMTGTSQSAVANFFGVDDWPNELVEYDLGGRVIDVIPIPGHQSAHIALYDRETGILFTGDTLYPGRLYIANFIDYKRSIDRLVDFLAENTVCWVLGTHIEMTNEPGVDYQFGATHHPDEHPLQLTADHLLELYDAVIAMGGTPEYEIHDSFIVFPLGGAASAQSNGDACCVRPKSPFDLRRAMRYWDKKQVESREE